MWTVLQLDGLVQDCSNSIADALELLQSCTKTSSLLCHVDGLVQERRNSIANTLESPLPCTILSMWEGKQPMSHYQKHWYISQFTHIYICITKPPWVNKLRPRQYARHFADDIFRCIFLNKNVWIPIKISLKCVPKGWINNIQTLVQIMAWRRPGYKPLSEPMMVNLLTHICVTRPQWVNGGSATKCCRLV